MHRVAEGSGNDVLMALKDELQYNPLQAVQSIARLTNIAQALGADRTRNELLPYLTSEIQQGNLNDEVLRSIAESLHQLVLFVTTTEDVGHLIAPLHELCCAEEHVVRDQAVRTVLRIGEQLPARAIPVVSVVGPEQILAELRRWPRRAADLLIGRENGEVDALTAHAEFAVSKAGSENFVSDLK